jgi:hypothetical protein
LKFEDTLPVILHRNNSPIVKLGRVKGLIELAELRDRILVAILNPALCGLNWPKGDLTTSADWDAGADDHGGGTRSIFPPGKTIPLDLGAGHCPKGK